MCHREYSLSFKYLFINLFRFGCSWVLCIVCSGSIAKQQVAHQSTINYIVSHCTASNCFICYFFSWKHRKHILIIIELRRDLFIFKSSSMLVCQKNKINRWNSIMWCILSSMTKWNLSWNLVFLFHHHQNIVDGSSSIAMKMKMWRARARKRENEEIRFYYFIEMLDPQSSSDRGRKYKLLLFLLLLVCELYLWYLWLLANREWKTTFVWFHLRSLSIGATSKCRYRYEISDILLCEIWILICTSTNYYHGFKRWCSMQFIYVYIYITHIVIISIFIMYTGHSAIMISIFEFILKYF